MIKSKSLLMGLAFLLIGFMAKSQKLFQVTFKFPPGLNTDKLKIFYNNGKEYKKIKPPFQNNEVSVSDSFFSKFATIGCYYYADGRMSSTGSSYFIWDSSATIIIENSSDTLTSSFTHSKLTNACDIDKTDAARRFASYASSELEDYENFERKFGYQTFENDSLSAIRKMKYNVLLKKKLDFVKKNGSLYYSLWLFKTDILNSEIITDADSLLKIFSKTFTSDLKNTFEGKQIEIILGGRANIAGKNYAPYFKSVDIQNRTVDLNNFKGKFVLLNFWASWCAPCIAEFGIIKHLNDEYGKKKLAVISVSLDQDKKSFIKAVKKYKMNWINIFHDIEIEKIFLKGGGIPQVYLIDTNGKLIYSREEEKDYDLSKLKNILKSSS